MIQEHKSLNADNAAIASLHYEYRKLTNFDIKLDFSRERSWYEWMKRGHDVESLRLVVRYLQSEIRKGNRNVGSLKFHNLIQNCDHFDEDCAIAKAVGRVPKIDQGKADVLKATHRPTQAPQRACRSAEELIRDSEAFKQFQALKTTL